ncbi:MAG: glycosyltransferase [Bacilli bacterium]|nr:glycosyltransferase [Bacilli bacterium]MBR3049761.1 glycosyltransferase [Bacilli bacterium]
MDKLVSVVIPAYNHEKYIEAAIKSVLNQTYKNIELIVEDDSSTDNTAKIIKKIKDKRLKTVFPKKNKGTVRTINHLLNMCKGDYIAILGSDDVWYPEKIEKQLKYFKKGIGAVFSMADIIDEKGNKYDEDKEFSEDIFKYENMSQAKRLRLFYEKGNHLCHPSSIVTREVLEEIGLYNPLYRQLHDFDYWTRLLNKYNIEIVPERLLGYRRFREKKSNLSSNTSKNLIRHINEYYNIIEKMFKEIDDKLFIEGFKDLFKNKKSSTKLELTCEKYFILSKLNAFSKNNELALNLLFESDNIEEILKLLEKKYKYTLNDIYEDTGIASQLYPTPVLETTNKDIKKIVTRNQNLDNRINALTKELEGIYSSKSWKVTKPLRKFTEMISHGKHKN